MLCVTKKANAQTLKLEFALVTISVMLVSPIVWYPFYFVTLLPMILIADSLPKFPRFTFLKYVLLVGYCGINFFGIIRYTRLQSMLEVMVWFPHMLDVLPYVCMILIWGILVRLLVYVKFQQA